MTTLLLVGATGLVGRHALQAALEDSRIVRIVAPTRRPLDHHPKLHNPLVDFARLPVDADWWRVTSVVCALGTTQAKAGSTEAFRKVDHDYPLQIAQITREAGAQSFALCSSLGADAASRFTYLRTKGQLEDDLCKLGFPSVTILRPGFLEGSRDDHRPFQVLTAEILRRLRPIIPKTYRLSPATVVARLLIDGAVAGLPGRHIVEAGDIANGCQMAIMIRTFACAVALVATGSLGPALAQQLQATMGCNASEGDDVPLDLQISGCTTVIELGTGSANDLAVAFSNRGNAYRVKGQHDRAIDDLDQAIKLDPNNANAFINRGVVYNAKGQHDRAIQDLDQAIKLGPGDARAYHNRGAAYGAKGQHDRAIQDFDQAINLNPARADIFYNRGLAYRGKGLHDRAIQDYDQAIKLNPRHAYAFHNRGNAYGAKGQYDRAIQDFDEAIKLNPSNVLTYNNRGFAYRTKGQNDRAIEDFDQAIKLKPDYAQAYLNRGKAYADKGQHDRAIQDYDQAIKLDPRDAETLLARSLAKTRKGNKKGADADLAAARRIDPNIGR